MALWEEKWQARFWKIYGGLLLWEVVFFLGTFFGLRYIDSAENTGVYVGFLALYFVPLLLLNIWVLWYFVYTLRRKRTAVWGSIGGALLIGLFDIVSLGVFYFISFVIYGFGP